MLHDLRYSARLLARRPGFTAVALLSLALGLGGASITFGLVDGLVLKPFAYPDPARLVTIGVNFPKMGDSGESRFIEALSPVRKATSQPLHEVRASIKATLLQDRRTDVMTQWLEDLDGRYDVAYAQGFEPPELPEDTSTETESPTE